MAGGLNDWAAAMERDAFEAAAMKSYVDLDVAWDAGLVAPPVRGPVFCNRLREAFEPEEGVDHEAHFGAERAVADRLQNGCHRIFLEQRIR